MHDLASGIFKCRRPPQWGHEHIHLFPLRWTRPAVFHTASLSHPAGLLTWAHFQPDAFPTLVGPVADVRRIPLTALGTSRSLTAFPILPPKRAPDGVATVRNPACRHNMYLADIFPKAKVTTSHCVGHIFRNSPSASAPTFLLTVTVHTATGAEVLDRLFKN